MRKYQSDSNLLVQKIWGTAVFFFRKMYQRYMYNVQATLTRQQLSNRRSCYFTFLSDVALFLAFLYKRCTCTYITSHAQSIFPYRLMPTLTLPSFSSTAHEAAVNSTTDLDPSSERSNVDRPTSSISTILLWSRCIVTCLYICKKDKTMALDDPKRKGSMKRHINLQSII